MALEKHTNHTIYFNISYKNGKIYHKCEPDEPDAVKVTDNEGNVTYRMEYNSVTGIIKSLTLKENNFDGKTFRSWNLYLRDDKESYCLQVSEESSFALTLLGALWNVDLSKPVKIRPYVINNKESTTRGITVIQFSSDDEEIKIPNYFFKSELENGKYVKKYFNGFPPIPANADKEDYKITLIQQYKFIRNICSVDLAGKIEEYYNKINKIHAPENKPFPEKTENLESKWKNKEVPF